MKTKLLITCRKFKSGCTLLVGLLLATAGHSISAQSPEQQPEWTQWRGPQRTGYVSAGALPAGIDQGRLPVAWRVPLQPGYSGPIIADGKIYVTETRDRRKEVVTAYRLADGEKLWEQSWEGAMEVPFFAKANGDWIRATPACDDGQLFVAGMRDVLVCLDAEDGDVQWRMDFVRELGTPLPDFGFVSSPLVDGPHVYVQAGGGLCKLDRQTGKIVWRSLNDGGGMNGSAFSSPIMATIRGHRQLVVQTRTRLTGVDPDTGDELWSVPVPAFRGMNILTPTIYGDQVFTSAYGGKSMMFDIRKDGQEWTVSEAWINRSSGYMSSPIVIGDYLYMHLRNQRFTCIDLRDGKTMWTTKPFGKYWSMVSDGEKILALDERGELLLIRANPDAFELLERRPVSDSPTWAHLAVAGNRVAIRALNELLVLEAKREQSVRSD